MTDTRTQTNDSETTDAAAPATPDADGAQAESPPKKLKTSKKTLIAMAAVLLIGILVILYAWRLWPFTSPVQRTENAYIRGQITAMAPQVAGYVVEVRVQDFSRVKQGDVLMRIDDRIYRQQLNQAQAQLRIAKANLANWSQTLGQNQANLQSAVANLSQAEAEMVRAKADFTRVSELAERGSVSNRERDQARAQQMSASAGITRAQAAISVQRETIQSTRVSRESLQGAVDQAQAQVDLARVNLDNTVIRAPRDGQIGEASVRVGQYAAAGSQLMFLVPDQLWAVANFKETQVARMRLGQPVTLEVDALEGARLHGRVEQLAPATGSEFSVLRPDNASGNFTKIVQRIPVRIRIDPGQSMISRLRPGMSIVASVDTTGTEAPGEVTR